MSRVPRRLLIPIVLFPLLTLWSIPGWAQNVFDTTPSLVFSTSPTNQPINLTLRQPSLRYDLKVYATKSNLKDVSILAEPFLDENLRKVQPRLSFDGDSTDTPRDLKSGDSKRLILEADFPELGTYTTYLTPRYCGRSWPPLTVTVNRVSPKPQDLEIADLPAGRAELWGCAETRKASIPIALSEKNGQAFALPMPQLFSFAEKDGEGKFSAKVKFSVHGENEKTVSASKAKAQPAQRVIVELSDFPEAGLYEGVLRFTVPGAAPVNKNFSVYIREPIWILFLWISAGALLSVVLREYLARRRPRLVQLRRASVLAQDLDTASGGKDLDAAARQLESELKSQLTHIVHELQLDTVGAETAKSLLDVFGMKTELLEAWLLLHEEELKAGGAAKEALIKGLREIATVLRNPQADDSTVRNAFGVAAGLWQYTSQEPTAALRSVLPSAGSGKKPASRWADVVRQLNRIPARLLTSDVLATTAIIVLAALLGVKALWINDLTWGGWEDWVIALLWGLGLHQTSFTGIDALRLSFSS